MTTWPEPSKQPLTTREISRQTLAEVCEKLGIDPGRTTSFTVNMRGTYVEITTTEPVRLFERMEHDPF